MLNRDPPNAATVSSEHHGRDDTGEIRNAGEAPAAAVQAEPDVRRKSRRQQDGKDRQVLDERIGAQEAVIAECQRDIRGDHDGGHVDPEQMAAPQPGHGLGQCRPVQSKLIRHVQDAPIARYGR
jgi:hypothetical protein